MKKDSEQFFQELKQDIARYAGLKVELLKLGAYERMGIVISILSYSLILLILVFFLTLFIFIALGFFLSSWFHSMGIGFSIIAVLYLLIISGIVLFREKIRTAIQNLVLAALTTNDNSKNNATDEDNAADGTVEP
ncbi:MAG: hypothetical protein LBT78_09120 [Tannerella sp.]|jgi:hypothetical protein|nr:hypothetical protein [Tannerella sp.]